MEIIGGFVFFWGRLPGKGAQLFLGECDLHRNYDMVVTLLSFICNYDNLTLNVHQKNRSNRDERWLFIGRFKVGSPPEKSVAFVASSSTMSMMQGH